MYLAAQIFLAAIYTIVRKVGIYDGSGNYQKLSQPYVTAKYIDKRVISRITGTICLRIIGEIPPRKIGNPGDDLNDSPPAGDTGSSLILPQLRARKLQTLICGEGTTFVTTACLDAGQQKRHLRNPKIIRQYLLGICRNFHPC